MFFRDYVSPKILNLEIDVEYNEMRLIKNDNNAPTEFAPCGSNNRIYSPGKITPSPLSETKKYRTGTAREAQEILSKISRKTSVK